LQHLRSTDGGATWSKPVRVDAGTTAPHIPHRGMDAQIAASGAKLVAIWNTPGTGFMGRGPMATAISTDGGATWEPGPNPADDDSSGDHSFVDCAADTAGAFHLVWLDARGTNKSKGLRYASSKDGGQSWSKNATLKADTCECCWNTLAVGTDGSVHALFRDKNPRDMAVISSTDRGVHWSDPAKVGRFNWDFQGCPHVGGGLIARGSALHALVWTGATGHSGAYHLSSPDRGQSWSAPQRLGDADARRGDLASTGAQSLAAVWDRVSDGESTVFASTSANDGQTWTEPKQLSAKGVNAAYPRVVAVAGGYRVFWTESATGKPSVWKSAPL
jgi:Neuraminidase (sialidase)